ncbi:PRKG2, partial [Symbiodinium microadriaticum]
EEDMPPNDTRTVQFNGAVSTEAIPACGRRRPSRERQATPFVKEEDIPPNDTRNVQFSGAVSTEAIPAPGGIRPSRERQATPFVKEEDVPPNDARTVQFSAAVSTEAIPGSGSKRSSRERQATPFVKEEDVPNNVRTVQFSGALASEASVHFSDTVSIASGALELPETVPEVGNRSVRDHIATPYAPAAALSEDRRVLLAPVVSTVEELEVQGSGETFRSSRDRMPTPYVSTDMVEDTPPDAAAKTVRILGAAEIQAIPASGQRRSSRDRQATPFVKGDVPDDMRTVQFSNVVNTEVQPMSQDDVRSTRDRVATPFAQPAEEDAHQDRRVALAPVLSVVEEFETDGSVTVFRPSRDRMPTPYMSAQLVEEDAVVNAGKTVRVLPFADAKAIPISGQCRSSRERQATPFFKDESVAERTVQFNEMISTEASVIAEGCEEVGRRSVHDRIATPYAGNVDLEESRVVVPLDTSVEEFEVEGLEVQLRSSRDRIPTPHVSTEMLEEAFPNSGKSVRIFPVAEMQAIATSGQRRSSRERQATPFFKDQDFDVHDGGRSVNFDDTISTEAVLVEPQADRRPVRDRISTPFTSMAFSSFQDRRVQLSPAPTAVEEFEPASQRLRPSRDRMPTPHVSTSMIEETFANFSKTVRVFPAAETEVIHLDGQRRPVRERQATPFFKEDSDLDSKAVEFSDKVSWETPSKVVAAPQSKVGRSVRDRVATPFVAEAQEFEDHRVLLTTVVSTVEEFEVTSNFRSSRDRIPTPYVTSEMQETLNMSPGKTVRVSPAVDVEAIPASGKTRSSRDRQATPFFKEDVVNTVEMQNDALGQEAESVSERLLHPLKSSASVRIWIDRIEQLHDKT